LTYAWRNRAIMIIATTRTIGAEPPNEYQIGRPRVVP
jgi:hypothetical protein